MSDLIAGLVIIAALSAGLFWLGQRLASRWSRGADLLALLTIALMVVYTRFLWDSILLARLLPFSNLVVLANWFPLAAGFLAGIAWRRIPGGRLRKGLPVAGLLCVGAYAAVQPIVGAPPECSSSWNNGVCLQTTSETCSPACAATLLAAAGIRTTEEEMARLCLTRKGTTWQGLYRGLKLKTAGTGWDVQVFADDLDGLRRRAPGPIILAVGIDEAADVDPIYTGQYGWTPGEWHSVVLFDFLHNERVAMGDPGIGEGREEWSLDDLRVLWRGRGMRLVPRRSE